MAVVSTNKRRRREGLHVSDLPDNTVAHVATYLPNVSRAIFAIALPSASQLTILSSDKKIWETLDFGDIDKNLAEKLKDSNIRDILTIIDAVNNTKIIKLTGCININGSGLSSLRGSVVLKQLDLSLVGQYERPELYTEPAISEETVVPILTSIINTEGNSLVYLQLPKKWRVNKERDTLLANFLTRYSDGLESHQRCSQCNDSISNRSVYHSPPGRFYGLQNGICCRCLKSFCDVCEDEEDERGTWLKYCNHCERDYCHDCITEYYHFGNQCYRCEKTFCTGCDKLKLCRCEREYCGDCTPHSLVDTKECDSCDCFDTCCRECAPPTFQCKFEGCKETYCDDCEWGHLLSHAQGSKACDSRDCSDTRCKECAPPIFQCKFEGCKESYCDDCEWGHLLSHAQGSKAY